MGQMTHFEYRSDKMVDGLVSGSDKRQVRETSVGQTSVGQTSVGQTSVGQTSVGKKSRHRLVPQYLKTAQSVLVNFDIVSTAEIK